MIAAGIAAMLITGVQPLALASTPSGSAVTAERRPPLTWYPPNRRLIRASQVTSRTPATTAVFHVPDAARPLLQAARQFSCSAPGHRPAGRLFAATPFSNERIAAAAANCNIALPSQQSLQAMWHTRVTCSRVDPFGTRFDASFADDQEFDPGR